MTTDTSHQQESRISAQQIMQFATLFAISTMLYAIGSGIMALIALYAQELGGSPTAIGTSLAIAFAALSISTLFAGYLSNHFNRRKVFILLAVGLSAPSAFLIAFADNMLHLTIGVSIIWFLFGIISTMITILTGLTADVDHRGATFGVVGASLPAGQFIGGLLVGPIVDMWGYPAMFSASAVVYIVILLTSLMLQDTKTTITEMHKQSTGKTSHNTNIFLYAIMFASVLLFSISFMTNMARPMLMEVMNFNPTSISSVSAVSGIAILPLSLIVGWASDRIGRPLALIVSYILPAIGLAFMLQSSALWHFWLAQSLVAVVNLTQTVGSAMITDIVPSDSLDTALSRYNATTWIGAVVGFIGSGLLIEALGLQQAVVAGIIVVIIAVLQIIFSVKNRTKPIQARSFHMLKG